MNKSDSERIAAILQKNNYQLTEKITEADLIAINMCSVRQSAVNRIYGLKKKFSELGKNKKNLKTVLTGCYLPSDEKKFKNFFNFIFKINDLNKFSNWLGTKNNKIKNYLSVSPVYSSTFSAYVPIMTGCNNFCAYCVVPYTREREISRRVEEIIFEVKNLIKKGFKQIILLGQNVNSYQGKIKNTNKKIKKVKTKKFVDFADLLKLINDIPGKFWLTFITSHPKDLSDKLIKIISAGKKIMPYLHLPVQAGNDKILKKMNRGYTIKNYKNLIYKIRKKNKTISISTDIIVGFPGETKKQFAGTADLMRQIGFDMSYLAEYSPRPLTAANRLKDDVPIEEKKQRLTILNEILKKTALKNNQKYLNKKIEVLITNFNKKGFYQGLNQNFKNVVIYNPKKKPIDLGNFYKIKIKRVISWGLEGEF
jgi:tRNA-2-methylthio-N6-dimethylallyladenosine synthase